MKTALMELIEWMKQPDFGYFESELDDKIQQLLAKEKQDIIDAYDAGHETDFELAEIYFTQKYKQQ